MDNLQQAIAKREQYLKERPHLIEKQREIDNILDKCTDEDRYEVVMLLLCEQMKKQVDVLNAISKGLSDGQGTL